MRQAAAIYARKSTDQNGVADEARSVTRQVEHAKAYAVKKGWTVADEYVYVDDGISGAEFTNRPGYMRLLNALKPRAPFEVLIVSELSRVGREQFETGYALKQLSQAGVKVFSYLEDREILLDTPTEKFLMSAVSFAAEIEREKARQRTYDAMRRKALAGEVTGGRVFGYENVRRDTGGVRRVVHETAAAVVREIFRFYAAGLGVRAIAKQLNEGGAPSPRPQQNRPKGWAPSSVHEVLSRPLYRGEVVWGQTRKRDHWGVKRPTAQREEGWIRVDVPELRIVSEDLWQAVQARRTMSRACYLAATGGERFGRPANGRESKYLLTGLARCACCGGGLIVRSRSHGGQRAYFYCCGCYHERGRSICSNSLHLRLEVGDDAILSEVERFVLHPRVVSRALALALAAFRPASGVVEAERARVEAALRGIERELSRLTAALATGGELSTLVEAIRDREERRTDLVARLTDLARVRAFRVQDAREIERKALKKLDDWRGLLRSEVQEARSILRPLVQDRITFEPTVVDGQRGYRYTGRFTLGPLFEDFEGLCPRAWASPTGFEPVF